MFSLLIVDDEIHAIEGLKSDLDVEKLNISEVFTARNIRQAKEIFKNHTIDIMLCDIEMPLGNGFELLEWVNEKQYKTETIFLTCHAEFHYAKSAIQLGSLDYLLKPIPVEELEKTIYKAIENIQKRNEFQEYKNYQELWNKHQPLIIENFWTDLLHENIPSTLEEIKKITKIRNIPFEENLTFIPIIINIQRWHNKEEWTVRDKKILQSALKNTAEEIIIGNNNYGHFIELVRGKFVVIYNVQDKEMEQAVITSLKKRLEKYIHSCNRYFYCDLSCYIGGVAQAHELLGIVKKLEVLDRNNVIYDNKVFILGDETNLSVEINLPDMSFWISLINKGEKRKALKEISMFLDNLINSEELDSNTIRKIHQTFLQAVYYVLNLKGIQANQLFCDYKFYELYNNSVLSVKDMKEWMNYVIEKSMDQIDETDKTNTVIKKVKRYISLNIDKEDLSRAMIAKHVYLNEDYLSRLFKKETGLSLSTYMIQERIKLAIELLSKTNMNIRDIASSVGYYNFSYFSKLFKKHTGFNPKEYRKVQNQ